MEDLKVLITCSGLGSRLGEITNYTNKSLVRVGKKPTLTHIIDSYPNNTKFVITIGHFGDHIEQYLKIAHSDRQIDIVNVDKYEGHGSSLAYSMFKAKNFLKSPFIFHACDTIATHSSFDETKNGVWISNKRDNVANYRTAFISGESLRQIQDKGTVASGHAYIGKCYIKDYKIFWKKIENIVERHADTDSSLSDCHAINAMLNDEIKFNVYKSHDWIDIGNVDSLNHARTIFKEDVNVLDKFDESIFFVKNKVIKFFHDKKIVENRVKRTSFMPECVPEITYQTDNFFSYDLVQGDVLSRKENFNNQTIKKLLEWANENLWSKNTQQDFTNNCYNFYVKKSIERIDKYLNDRHLVDEKTIINGIEILPAKDLINLSKEILLSDISPSYFHGDFILENILQTSNNHFFLIDWRQDFAGNIDFGDAYYDISKMNHNLIVNHDIINEKNYKVEFKSSSEVYVDILCSKKFVDAREELRRFCVKNNFNSKKVEILTSIIWINMSPLHDKHFGDFLFHFGRYNLFEALKYE